MTEREPSYEEGLELALAERFKDLSDQDLIDIVEASDFGTYEDERIELNRRFALVGKDWNVTDDGKVEVWLTDDGLIAQGIAEWEGRGFDGPVDDRTARIIASQFHPGQGSKTYAFASSGAIDVEGIWAEVARDFYVAVDRYDKAASDKLAALKIYTEAHGKRGPVEGWHEATQW